MTHFVEARKAMPSPVHFATRDRGIACGASGDRIPTSPNARSVTCPNCWTQMQRIYMKNMETAGLVPPEVP